MSEREALRGKLSTLVLALFEQTAATTRAREAMLASCEKYSIELIRLRSIEKQCQDITAELDKP